jgi:ATP-dependent DNA helicase RecG
LEYRADFLSKIKENKMRLERILALLKQKESSKLEFKEVRHDVPSSLFETVCAFLNRDGGDIFLGVNDSGEITGIDEPVIDKMMKEITTGSNNPLVLDPPFILFPEKINVEGRWILYIQVPESSSVFRCKGIVYDRGADGDFRLKEPERIADLANKKKGFYSEARVYPYIELADLDAAVIKKTRNRIYSKNPEHPWLPLSDEEMLVRAGLIKKDIDTGIKGLTLAAALLFGKEETIQSIIPQYKVDVLVKRNNLARYDDRLDVRSNLLEAYPAIMSFLERHLPDPFYMEKDVRLSLREKIFREAVANLLVHREYLHRYPARIIITRDQVEFTNPCNPVFKGNLEANNYIPHQKNPLISKFFLQLGWVEEIGTGIYNVNRYLPFYAPGGKASFKEDVIFTTTIPIPNPDELRMCEVKKTIPHDIHHDTPEVTPQVIKFLQALEGEMSSEELLSKLELKDREHLRKGYLKPARESGFIELTLPGKPKSSKQKYRITGKGKIFLRSRIENHEG